MFMLKIVAKKIKLNQQEERMMKHYQKNQVIRFIILSWIYPFH